MAEIIFFRGAPGVGKSTLSSKIKPFFPNGITIEVGFFLKLFNGFEDGDSAHYSNTLDCIYDLSLKYLNMGYHPILIVGPMKHLRMNNHFLFKIKNDYRIVTLVAEKDILEYRIDNRPVGFKDKTVAHVVNQDMKLHRFEKELYIDTSEKDSNEVFNEVRKFLNL